MRIQVVTSGVDAGNAVGGLSRLVPYRDRAAATVARLLSPRVQAAKRLREDGESGPLRILMLHPFLEGVGITPFIGGKSVVAYQLSEWLVEQGHAVAILPWKESLSQECTFRIARGQARVFPTLPFRGLLPTFLALIRDFPRLRKLGWRRFARSALLSQGLRNAIREFKPDIIHVHYTRSTFPILYPAKRLSVPAILTHHHGVGNDLDAFRLVVFPSRKQQEERAGERDAFSGSAEVIHNPVGEAFFAKDYVPASERKAEAVFIGTLKDDRKGLDILLEAYASEPALAAYPLKIVGDGALRPRYEAFAAARGLNVRFLGHVVSDDLLDLMSACRVLVVPSRMESFGVVYAESACCGTPSIGYAPMIRELGGAIGRAIGTPFDTEKETPEILAHSLLTHLREFQTDESGKEMQAHARRRFRRDDYGEAYLRSYRKLLSHEA